MIVSIHQPNLFPFEGILEKIRASDRFIVLTQCQYERGNYQNRFHLNDCWYTMSVSQRLEPLTDKRYNAPQADWAAIKRKLPDYADILSKFDDCIGPSLVETNVAILRRICVMLGIKTQIVMDYPTTLNATHRLVDLCKHYGATTYLSGPSGSKYLKTELFAAAGIMVEVQKPTTRGKAAIEMLSEAL